MLKTTIATNRREQKQIKQQQPVAVIAKSLMDPVEGVCATATSFSDLKKLFRTSRVANQVIDLLTTTPLSKPLAETQTVLSCCDPDIERLRQLIAKFSDLKILVFGIVADEVSLGNNNSNNTNNQNQTQMTSAAAATSPSSSSSSSSSFTPQRRGRLNNNNEQQSSNQQQQQKQQQRQQQQMTPRETFLSNAVGLLYGLVFPTSSAKQPVACAALVEEKEKLETSDEYQLSNAAERRKVMQNSVLSIFSDRGQRFYFSKVWTNLLAEVLNSTNSSVQQQDQKRRPKNSAAAFAKKFTAGGSQKQQQEEEEEAEKSNPLHILSLHLLTDINNAIIPWLTNPLLLSDSLSEAYRAGGLLAVLALEGLLTLMIQHGLEYPKFYTGLYSLVTPDICSSPHRNRFFRLLSMSMSSVRVSAAIAASFVKKLARCALVSPTPALYFILPFVRQKLQQHSNCFALIHRSLRDVEEAEAELEKEKRKRQQQQQQKGKNNNKRKGDHEEEEEEEEEDEEESNNKNSNEDHVERLKNLFEGIDPFDENEADPEKSHAIDSTLWEIAALERHALPAARNAVAALASPAEDHQQLQFERSYGRLFAHAVSNTEKFNFCSILPSPEQKKKKKLGMNFLSSVVASGGKNNSNSNVGGDEDEEEDDRLFFAL